MEPQSSPEFMAFNAGIQTQFIAPEPESNRAADEMEYENIELTVSAGETSSGMVLAGPGGADSWAWTYLTVYGTVSNTTVGNRAQLYVSSGGSARETAVTSGGFMYVTEGWAGGIRVLAGGSVRIRTKKKSSYSTSRGVAEGSGIVVESGGALRLGPGGTVSAIQIQAGGAINGFILASGSTFKQVRDGAIQISGATAEYAEIYSGGRASMTTVSGGLTVSSGGSAYRTEVLSGGVVAMSSGATLTETTIRAGASINGFLLRTDSEFKEIKNGVLRLSGAVVSGTYASLYDGSVGENLRVEEYGTLNVSSGARTTGTTVLKNGNMTVACGGSATGTVLAENTNMYITLAENTRWTGTSNGVAFDYGALATGLDLDYNKNLTVGSGGMAIGGIFSNLSVTEGGTVNGGTVREYGYMQVGSGGSATGTVLMNGASMYITLAENTRWAGTSNGVAFDYGSSATGLTLDNGLSLAIGKGGSATGTVVNSQMYIYNGGTATNTVLNDYAYLNIDAGTHRGILRTGETGQVYCYDGTIDFTLSGVQAGSEARIDNLAQVYNKGDYTVTVDADQEDGVYRLADGAENFTGTVTVCTAAGKELGTVALGGTLRSSGNTYALTRDDGALNFSVSGPGPGFRDGETIDSLELPARGEVGFDKDYQDVFGLQLENSGFYRMTGDFGKLNGSVTILNGKKSVATGTVKNGVLTFNKGKAALLDSSVKYSVSVKNTDKGKSASEYEFSFVADKLFTRGDNSDDWTDLKTAGPDGAVDHLGTVDDAGTLVSDGWVGYGDAVDYLEITLETAARLNFAIDATDAAKFSVHSLTERTSRSGVTTYSLKTLQSATLKAAKGSSDYTATPKSLLLTAGTYYLAIKSGNATKGGDAAYTVAIQADSVFFPMGNNTNDTWKAAAANEAFDAGERIDGWVGYGDAADFYRIETTEDGRISLDFDETTVAAIQSKQLKITCVTDRGKSVSLSFDDNGAVSKKTVAAGTYYLGATCANVKKYDTSYDLGWGMLA